MKNKFIYSPTKSLFEKKLAAGEIGEGSVVFIEDTKEIWNRGHYFGMVGSGSGIDPEILSGIETAIATLQSDKADKSELSDYALKSELPSLDGYLTKTVADGLYATIAQYNAFNQTVGDIQTELSNKLTSTDLEGYAKTADIPTKISDLTDDSDFITNTEATTAYAPKSLVETVSNQATTISTLATKNELSTGLAGKLDNSAADSFVPTTRKVNGVALNKDITITATDPNAATKEELGKVNTDLQTFKNNVALTYATDQDVADAVAALVDSSPAALNTLNELAAALGDDPNFATTVATQIGTKADQTALDQTNTNVANLTESLSSYLPKSGGTMQGVITMPTNYQIQWGDSTRMIYGTIETIKVYAPSGFFFNDNKVLDAGNYSSYALPLSGGTISYEGDSGVKLSSKTLSSNYLWFEGIVNGSKLNLGALGMRGYNNPAYVSPTGFAYGILHEDNYSNLIGDYYLKSSGGRLSGNLDINTETDTTKRYFRMWYYASNRKNRGMMSVSDSSVSLDYYSPTDGEVYQITVGRDGFKYSANYVSRDVIHSGNIGEYKAGDSDKLGGYAASVYPTFENAATCIGFNLRTDYQALGQGDGYIEFYDNGWYNSVWGKVTAVSGFYGNLYVADSSAKYDAVALYTSYGLYLGSGTSGTYNTLLWGKNIQLVTGTNGQTRLYVANGGNVGIGTVDPKYKLDVVGKIRTSSCLLVGENADTGIWKGSLYSGTLATNDIAIHGDKIVLNGGNVLIGTTVDNGAKLQVAGTIVSESITHRASISDNAIAFYNKTNGGFFLYGGIREGEALSIEIADNTGSWVGNGITLKQNGNVGIGTTDPKNKLQVNGNTAITGTCSASSGFFETSDERLKDFTRDIEIDFNKLKAIPKKYFTWKNDEEKVLQLGTSAQAVQEVFPELVSGKDPLSVNYSKLVIPALAAIDKLYEENQVLKDRLTCLENKLNG